MQVFGYIRFSYLGRSDVRMSRVPEATPQDYFQRLFDPVRMETRFHFFEKVCLPSIAAQSDPDFTVLIMASQEMPEQYKNRLAKSVAKVPQIRICYSNAADVVSAFGPKIEALRPDITGNSIHFRLDDDDAIGVDMIADLRRMGEHAEPGTILSLPRGFHLFSFEEQPYLLPKFKAYIAIGFAFVNGPAKLRNPYASAHLKAFHKVPSRLDPRPHSYIHVAHPSSDTRARHNKQVVRLLNEVPEYHSAKFQENLRRQFADAFPYANLDEILNVIMTSP